MSKKDILLTALVLAVLYGGLQLKAINHSLQGQTYVHCTHQHELEQYSDFCDLHIITWGEEQGYIQ